jgi:hypothetical protein
LISGSVGMAGSVALMSIDPQFDKSRRRHPSQREN